MSETKGSKEQKQTSSVRRKPERESILTPTFAAARQNTAQEEQSQDDQAKSSLLQAETMPKQSIDLASNKAEASLTSQGKAKPAVGPAGGHDFSRVPAQSTPTQVGPSIQPKHTIQPKLAVNAPGDRYEQEADRVAEAVMEEPHRPVKAPVDDGKGLLGPAVPVNPLPSIARSKSGHKVGGFDVAPEVEGRIGRMQGGGHALPEVERSLFESRMGYDFSQVRIHTGPEAVQTSREISAHAYTIGRDIAFSEGAYRPGTETGRKLMAHELTHVVQQGGAGPQRKTTADNRVKSHLAKLRDRPGFDTSLYRKEIANFHREHTRETIHAGQRALLPGQDKATVRERDQSRTLRRCEAGPQGTQFAEGPTKFNPGKGGAIKVTSGGSYARLESPEFAPSGSVKITKVAGSGPGEQSREPGKWDAGFIQTQTFGQFNAYYKGSPTTPPYSFKLSGSKRDAVKPENAPWYSPETKKKFTGRAPVSVAMSDTPGVYPPWDTPDKKGKLDRAEGKTRYTAWMIAFLRESPHTTHYIKWSSWEVDWGATFKYATTGEKEKKSVSGKMIILGSGGDQESGVTPVLKGTIANEAVSDSIPEPWRKKRAP